MLVRLCKFQSYPQFLRELLADYDVVKTGVVILDDENKLMVDYNFDLSLMDVWISGIW